MGYASSGLPGPKGNLETFVWLAESGREGPWLIWRRPRPLVEPLAVEP